MTQFRPGHQKTGGRQRGTSNKLTDEVRKLAKDHGPAAIKKLKEIMDNARDERASVAAAKELLERAYGRSGGTPDGGGDGNTLRVVIVGDDAKL